MANEFDKNQNQQQDPQQKRDQGQGQGQSQNNPNQSDNPQDTSKKNPNIESEFPERKDREGSEDVEKRRAS